MAASSENLFNLVDQLQHLESTVTKLIFEMAFKLSSLTSSNIFLMVENNLGRKYGGKQNLCAEFSSAVGLKPIPNDIVVEFDPETGFLKEYPHPSTSHQTRHHHSDFHPPPPPNSHSLDIVDDLEHALFYHHHQNVLSSKNTPPNQNKKRRHSARDSNLTSGEKRRRQYNQSLNNSNGAVDPIAIADDDLNVFGAGDESASVPKLETDANSFQVGIPCTGLVKLSFFFFLKRQIIMGTILY